MKRVLVTGASGFIGHPAVRQLSARGIEVHAVTRRPARMAVEMLAAPLPAGSRAPTWHTCDLLSPGMECALFDSVRPTHWLHLAWVTQNPQYWTSSANLDWLAASTRCLAAFAACGGERVVGAGTCAEYDWEAGWCLEHTTRCTPTTLYGAAKHSLSIMQQAWCRQHAISQAWGRVFHLYGPGEAASRFVPTVIRALLDGTPARTTDGHQQRDLLYVDDVASAFVAMLDADHDGPFNIASAQPIELAVVAHTLSELIGRPDLLRLGALPSRAGDPPLLCGDNGVLRGLGWRPLHSLYDGLRSTIDWWRHAR
jgi:nucleoside-diphosphate-sugar epimerase